LEFNNIISSIKKEAFSPFYFLFGDEPYFIDQIMDHLEAHVLAEMEKSFNQTIVYGKEINVAGIIENAKRYPMGSERQLILVKEAQSISKIEEAILKALEDTPPELASDIYRRGLFLTGGGALLRGLDRRISSKTKLPVHIAEDPLTAVVRGTGIALKKTHEYSFLIDRKSI